MIAQAKQKTRLTFTAQDLREFEAACHHDAMQMIQASRDTYLIAGFLTGCAFCGTLAFFLSL